MFEELDRVCLVDIDVCVWSPASVIDSGDTGRSLVGVGEGANGLGRCWISALKRGSKLSTV